MKEERRECKSGGTWEHEHGRPFLIRNRATADMYDCRSIKRANLAGRKKEKEGKMGMAKGGS